MSRGTHSEPGLPLRGYLCIKYLWLWYMFPFWVNCLILSSRLLSIWQSRQAFTYPGLRVLNRVLRSRFPAHFYLLIPTSQIGRAHVWTPVTSNNLVCRLLLEKKKGKMTYKQIWETISSNENHLPSLGPGPLCLQGSSNVGHFLSSWHNKEFIDLQQ